MELNFLILNGYGQFVWPAFVFTFVSCFVLYLKTKKDLKKQEKVFFNEFGQLRNVKIEITQETKKEVSTLGQESS